MKTEDTSGELKKKREIPAIVYASGLLVLFVVVFTIANRAFLSPYNLKNIGTSASILLAVGLGQVFAILTGGIDLSVGGLMSLVSVIFMVMLPKVGYLAYPICIAVGITAGYINGNLLTRIKIPSFIATLGTGGIFISIAYLVSPVAISASTEIQPFLDFVNGTFFGIKNIMVIALVFFAIIFIFQRYTVLGRYVFYVGSNVKMAWLSGLNVAKTKNVAFTLSGLGAAIGGILLASNQYSGYPTIGTVYILNSIATVVVGGTALTGGAGGALNTLIGALIMSVLQNGMTVVGINVYFQQTLLGLLIVFSVAISFDRSKFAVIK